MNRIFAGLQFRPLALLAVFLFLDAGYMNAADKKVAPTDPVQDRTAKESADRENMMKSIDPILREATILLEKGAYREARTKCDQALSRFESMNLGAGPSAISQKSMILQLRVEVLRHWGKKMISSARADLRVAYNTGAKNSKLTTEKIQAAINTAYDIRREVPEYMKQADEIIAAAQKIQRSLVFENETSLSAIDPDNAPRNEKIAILLRQADVLYKNSLYAKSRDTLEQVLIDDPYNEKAISLLKRIYRRLYSVAEARRENEVLERMNEIEWKWSNAVLPTGDQELADNGPKEASQEGNSKIYDKLQTIIIPEVDFSGVNISGVIKQLELLSRENDPEKKGINFFYQQEGDGGKEVTMSFEKIPIGELIRYLCLATGLKYRVETNGVFIGAGDINSMTTRYFKMRMTTYNNISHFYGKPGVSAADAGTQTNTGAGKNETSVTTSETIGATAGAKQVQADTSQLKAYFMDSGIPFGEGASISYDKDSGTLTVTNTPDNLRKMETALKESDSASQMILIESKFLEIQVKDLEELGFDWTLKHNNTNPAWLTGVPDTTTGTIPFGPTSVAQTLIRHYGGNAQTDFNSVSSSADALINNMNIMPNFGPDGAYNVFLTVNAIDQTDRGETLSAPKVIAAASIPAMIKLAQDMYFPKSWTEAEVTSNNNTYQYTPAYPDFGEAEPIGIVFNVTPYLSPNRHTISLELKPQVRSLVGWDSYDYDIVIGNITSTATSETQAFSPKMKMPIIGERSVDTMLKIYDGETIVLGGIMEDTKKQRDDRYPFLGDVPLVGRLFSSQAVYEEKTNLLIFVTARIMKLDGLPATEKSDNGLFYFNR